MARFWVLSATIAGAFLTGACTMVEREEYDLLRSQLAAERKRCEEELMVMRSAVAHGQKAAEELAEIKSDYSTVEAERIAMKSKLTDFERKYSDVPWTAEEIRRMAADREVAAERVVKMEKEREEIERKLSPFMDLEKIGVDVTPLGVRITVQEMILFESGKASINAGAAELLEKVAAALATSRAEEIRIVGHTDDLPIVRKKEFDSNWELSTARALAVLKRLENSHGLPGERLTAIGYGQHRPVADNTTSEGRAKNRRVEIFLVPER